MLQKDYAAWHARKTLLNDQPGKPRFNEREIWWTAIGHNIGDEEDGKGYNFARPVLIMRVFNRSLFYGVPLSTAAKRGQYYHALTVRDRQNVVLLSHLRDYDSKRLINRFATISRAEFLSIREKLLAVLDSPVK